MIQVEQGYSPREAPRVAELFLSGFGAKLHNVVGQDHRAVEFFAAEIDPASTLVARADGQPIGALNFLHAGTSHPMGRSWANARKAYGLGAAWRLALLALLDQRVSDDALHIDWLCVGPQARGCGVGTALLEAAEGLAAARGLAALTLSVVDSNPRAKVLYERLGFVTVSTQRLPAPRRLFGFGSADEMRKDFG